MKPLKADIGFVFNSDMSRSAIVTDVGETLSEEYSFPIVADHVLSKSPPESAVVSNCCTTRTLDEVVAARGGVLYKAKVGQSHTIDKMFETSAVLAGDGSGSVAIAAGVPGFDSFALMILVLESMAASGLKSSEIAEKLPRYEIIKRSVPCPSAHAYSVLRSLRGSFPDAALSEDDGLRFDWKDGWVHLRASMTEPIVRMIVEWKGREEAEDMAMRISSMIERLVSS
jgi:phosphomannomutase